jgi:hypothetical protein
MPPLLICYEAREVSNSRNLLAQTVFGDGDDPISVTADRNDTRTFEAAVGVTFYFLLRHTCY